MGRGVLTGTLFGILIAAMIVILAALVIEDGRDRAVPVSAADVAPVSSVAQAAAETLAVRPAPHGPAAMPTVADLADARPVPPAPQGPAVTFQWLPGLDAIRDR